MGKEHCSGPEQAEVSPERKEHIRPAISNQARQPENPINVRLYGLESSSQACNNAIGPSVI